MIKTLQEIAAWLNIDSENIGSSLVTGVSINTRTLQAGDLFIPFKGETVNGHEYVAQAFELGAAAALWQIDEPNAPEGFPLLFVDNCEKALQQMAKAYRQEHQATFIGITGSNGKTSTKDLVAGVLSPYFRVQKTIGNYNNELGLPLTILSLHEETEIAVLEMGMSGFGEISFLSKIARPDFAVITNIGEAHMQDLGSREGIAKAKFEIVDGLKETGTFLYDGDEVLLRQLVGTLSNVEAISVGYGEENTVFSSAINSLEGGSEFTTLGLVKGKFNLPVFGKHQVKNALFAITIATKLGLTTHQVNKALERVSLTNMRMQPISAKTGALFINDAYNAAPTSMKAAITFVKESNLRNDKWLVLGDMLELGSDEQVFHEQLSEEITTEKFDRVLLYGPRMKHLYNKLVTVFGDKVLWSENEVAQFADLIKKQTTKDTIVLFKGSRGMKLEKIIELVQEN